jgi:hypothetical protein
MDDSGQFFFLLFYMLTLSFRRDQRTGGLPFMTQTHVDGANPLGVDHRSG